jgi:hypothetical protein
MVLGWISPKEVARMGGFRKANEQLAAKGKRIDIFDGEYWIVKN